MVSVTGPTKAELIDDIMVLLTEQDWADYVSFRGKTDHWYPTETDVRRALMARTRGQLWNVLDKLTQPI